MAVKFNPFTGQLQIDEKGSGGGGASYIDGEVQNFSALPDSIGSPAVDSAYLVREAEGSWLLNRKPAGIYIRTANTGVRADDWTHAGAFPDVFNDANFLLYDNADSTKNLAFQLSGITTGTTRTLTVPNANGTIARTQDFAAPPAIGNTTPAAGTFTTLNANGTGSADLVAEFGTAAAGRNHEIQIWGNAAGRNQVIQANSAVGLQVRMGNAGPSHCGLSSGATPTGFRQSANSAFAWSSSTSNAFSGTMDCAIFRDAADTVAQRRDANPQTFNIYNTFTSATNHERLRLGWSSNVAIIGTEKGSGGGTARALEIRTDNTARLTFGSAGTVTLNTTLAADAQNISTDTTTGTKIGTGTTQKIGFFNATPVVQQAAVADATDAASTQARLNDLLARLRTLGLIAT